MYVKYGTFQHDDNDVTLTEYSITPLRNARNKITAHRHTVRINGQVIASTQATIKTALDNIKTAYNADGKGDFGLYHDDDTASSHFLSNSNAVGGVRVQSARFPDDGASGVYATRADYEIVLEADYVVNDGDDLIEFRETVDFMGTGGPRVAFADVMLGAPVKETINRRTTVMAVQSGNAMGYLSYPNVPSPIWPQAEHQDRRRFRRMGPTLDTSRFINYGISWEYHFESATPLAGFPNVR